MKKHKSKKIRSAAAMIALSKNNAGPMRHKNDRRAKDARRTRENMGE